MRNLTSAGNLDSRVVGQASKSCDVPRIGWDSKLTSGKRTSIYRHSITNRVRCGVNAVTNLVYSVVQAIWMSMTSVLI